MLLRECDTMELSPIPIQAECELKRFKTMLFSEGQNLKVVLSNARKIAREREFAEDVANFLDLWSLVARVERERFDIAMEYADQALEGHGVEAVQGSWHDHY